MKFKYISQIIVTIIEERIREFYSFFIQLRSRSPPFVSVHRHVVVLEKTYFFSLLHISSPFSISLNSPFGKFEAIFDQASPVRPLATNHLCTLGLPGMASSREPSLTGDDFLSCFYQRPCGRQRKCKFPSCTPSSARNRHH